MKTKRWLSVMIVASWLSGTAVHAQQVGYQPIYPPPAPIAPDATPYKPADPIVPAGGVLSDWITYRRDCCEGHQGVYTPLYTELYLNAGPTVPVGGMTLSRELRTGWSITSGARALFFNDPHTRAWVVDLHIININESGGAQNTQFPVTFFQNGTRSDLVNFQGVTGRKAFSIHDYNRTMVGLGLGREWYLREPANGDGCKWRFGIDAGGRYGDGRVNFNEFGHVLTVAECLYAAAHTDLEFLWGSCLFHAGLRLEWSYTMSDVLQRTSDVQDLSLLLSFGVRF